MNWLYLELIILMCSVLLIIVGGFLYVTSKGESKRIAFSKNMLMSSLSLIMLSFLILVVDEMTLYKRSPISQDTIIVSDATFVRAENRGFVRYECAILDAKTNKTFIFSSSERDDVKSYCGKLETGDQLNVAYKDLRGIYRIVKE